MIEFRDVVVRYPGAPHPAVSGVSLVAARGAVTAVVGPNGSGKSTLVRALLGRQRAESGSVLIDGRDRREIDQRALARMVAIVPQREEPAFPMRVAEYVALGRLPHAGAWRAESPADRAAVDRAIALTDIEPFRARGTDELSGGEWQRLRVARALAQEAPALVLDEPTTFLDMAHEMALFELSSSLAASGLAVLVVSHQLNLVARFASTMVLLERGRVAAAGAPHDVMRADTLESVYEWPLVVTRDSASGAPSVVPLRRSPKQHQSPQEPKS
jgi:iron complex transport system ATP-binding protein